MLHLLALATIAIVNLNGVRCLPPDPPPPILWLVTDINQHGHVAEVTDVGAGTLIKEHTLWPGDVGYDQASPCRGISFVGRVASSSPGDTLRIFFPADDHEMTLVQNLSAMTQGTVDWANTTEEDLNFSAIFLPAACADAVVGADHKFSLYVDEVRHPGRTTMVVMSDEGVILNTRSLPDSAFVSSSP